MGKYLNPLAVYAVVMVLFMGFCMAPARSRTGCDDVGVARGLSTGQCNFGVAYAEGKGVPQDWVLAHKWFNISAINTRKEGAILAMKSKEK